MATNPRSTYRDAVRTNPLPGISVSGFYFFVNNKRFTNYVQAARYRNYLAKYDTGIANGFVPKLDLDFSVDTYEATFYG